MRTPIWVIVSIGVAACSPANEDQRAGVVQSDSTAPSFDGANYSNPAEKVAHGERLAKILTCSGCHGEDFSGADFGAMFPIVEGLWASNLSVTIPAMSDTELERLLREGVHPSREIYVMPSKQSQFLSALDMNALIAYLRTIKPIGSSTPLPPPGFEEAVTARLPDDYWRTTEDGAPRNYHNAAEEVAYFRANTVPNLGGEHAQGRLIAQTLCTSCHGAALNGLGEPAGDIQGALNYNDRDFVRLLRQGVGRDGTPLKMPWPVSHTPAELTDSEVAAVVAYTRALARTRDQ